MSAYYNDSDPFVAAWLRRLIAAGEIAPGEVDERDVRAIEPADLLGFGQCHFFAGIGGWSKALRLAGWPDERAGVWTASCPCQPVSVSGQRRGHADERHLWPALYRLVAFCRPAMVLGEQVAGADGREWLAAVRADLEAARYAVGAADLPAGGAGAPHIRQRLWWVALADKRRRDARPGHGSGSGGLAIAGRRPMRPDEPQRQAQGRAADRRAGGLVGLAGGARLERRELGAACEGSEGAEAHGPAPEPARAFWADCDWLPCRDGKARPVEPGTFPLAYGIPARVGRLRAYGNAIVPQLAAEFIGAVLDLSEEDPCPKAA